MFPLLLISVADRLISLNDQLLLAINSVAGRSWLFDSTVAFFLDNDLAKAGVVGCCFLTAWYGGKSTDTNTRRKILIATLVAAGVGNTEPQELLQAKLSAPSLASKQ